MPRIPVLDRTDRAIIAALQKNARSSNKELAARVGIAPSTCSERMRRLEQEGVFIGFHAAVDPRVLGIGLQAMIAVRLRRHAADEVDAFERHALGLAEVVTKPEYLIMPSSVGFWAIAMMFYLFGTRSGCLFFNWIRKQLKIAGDLDFTPAKRNPAMSTFMELILILWTFYLVLLFIYDNHFFGERSVAAYVVAFGSLLWSMYLFLKLLKVRQMAYALRYAVPTVIIFWNFVEIMGRWGMLKEIWIEPWNYWKELVMMSVIFLILVIITVREQKKKKGS